MWGGGRDPEGKASLGQPQRSREIPLKWIFKSGMWGINWIDPARDMDRWRALVKVAINAQVP